MATVSLPTKKMPLPVELFYSAMERRLPLTDYARNIDLSPDVLRQALTGRLPGTDSLNELAKAINRDPQQLDLTTPPCDQPFDSWLKRNMEGVTQHGLRTRAQLDSQTLKRFLNGDLLPDSDQAERISRALYIDRTEIAQVITANMAAASPALAGQDSPEPTAIGRQPKLPSESGTSTAAGQSAAGIRRKRAVSRQASAESATLTSTAAPAQIDKMAPMAAEPAMATTADSSKLEKRSKRALKPGAQLPVATVAAMATHWPHDKRSSLPAVEVQETVQDGASVIVAEVPPVDQAVEPAPQSARPMKSRSGRQRNQATPPSPTASVDASTSNENEQQPTLKEDAAKQPVAPVAVSQTEILIPPVPTKTIAEKEGGARRPKRSTSRGRSKIMVAEQMPSLSETQIAAEGIPVAEFVAEESSSTQASSGRRPRTIESPVSGIPTTGDMPSALPAELAPSKPDERGADISMERTVPIVTADLAAEATSLQLSRDEARLIRHWRQLHPQGRRATLQYIGSLLVED